MIINFSIQNYRSFKERATLSLEPVGKSNKSALPFAVIFGPNASGKSNIFKGFEFMRFAMQNQDAINQLTVKNDLLQPFLLCDTSPEEPIGFEITVFHSEMEATYRYGFEIHKEKIKSEWLIESALRNKRITERELYVRNGDKYTFSNDIKPFLTKQVQETIPNVVLALPRLANNNVPQALALIDLVINKVINFDCTKPERISAQAFQRLNEDPELKEKVINIVKDLDFSIQGIDVTQRPMSAEELSRFPDQFRSILPTELPVTLSATTHNVYDKKGGVIGQTKFDYYLNESLGTQNLIPFITMLVDSMDNGFILLVDEFGSGFHPFITAAIVKFFTNIKHDAQLIALTHETYLLNQDKLIGSDSIWFVEKNNREESSLVSLIEYKARGDARIEKQYLEGRFGAVPIVLEK